ncbi:helix-turn-helix domain-containing protein [Aestuariibaculum sp. M13]|uniref:helix-turn-helix domain-containing protein n=1 Tax=Aestuariibaculum sp. M13 TaxID=2967132 RepID=UPI002159CE78|nr:helix-turn-helix domain-containing protein [Aestuariibaculum sp. M13]MCR8667949.1 helix-turn-helix domain-containing protein [Aestuariibaculum sp. M13]
MDITSLKFEDLPEAMTLLLSKVEKLEDELKTLKEHFQPKEPLELMSVKETADFFKVGTSTLWRWNKMGKLKAYGVGYRVYYKRKEIEEALILING